MREAFGTEEGDEFMSLVFALEAEARGRDSVLAQAAGGELERMLSGQATMQDVPSVAAPRIERPVPVPPRPLAVPHRLVPVATPRPLSPVTALRPLVPVAAPAAVSPPARPTVVALPVRPAASEPVRSAPTFGPAARALRPSTLVDELTGIGGPLALKRDLMLERSLPTPRGPRFALITIVVHPVAEVRERRGDAVADQLFKALVDAVQVSLRPSDSIYRSGPDELTLLLRGRDAGSGDQARAEMEAALRQALGDRGLPLVRLSTAAKGARPAVVERQAAAV